MNSDFSWWIDLALGIWALIFAASIALTLIEGIIQDRRRKDLFDTPLMPVISALYFAWVIPLNLGRVDSFDPELCGCDAERRKIGSGGFLITGGDVAELLQAVDAALDQIAPLVGSTILSKFEWAGQRIGAVIPFSELVRERTHGGQICGCGDRRPAGCAHSAGRERGSW